MEKRKEKADYIIYPDDIERKDGETTNLPFWLHGYYDIWTKWYLALYWKDYEIIKITLHNIQEANCIILWVIEWFRQVQSELFNLWIID